VPTTAKDFYGGERLAVSYLRFKEIADIEILNVGKNNCPNRSGRWRYGEGLTGTAYGEKSPERLAQRNGYRDRDWETRAGSSTGPSCTRSIRSTAHR
jgi:hypothetical protein